MKKFIFIFIIILSANSTTKNNSCDCVLIGFLNNYDGIGQVGLSFINCLKNLNIQLLNVGDRNKNIPENAIDLVKKSIPFSIETLHNIDSKMLIFTDLLWNNNIKYIPNKFIKFAYSMTEFNSLPAKWIDSLNKYFDAVLVPDKFFIKIYKNSGVKIPIFVLPLSLNLEKFLNQPKKKEKNSPFVFGCSAGFWQRKNHIMLIDAFMQEFKNDDNFKLILHGRGGQYLEKIENKLKQIQTNNIKLINKVMDQTEYLNFLKSLDCYVLISKGEGFSITPREALALGIPCIITNNTAHQTICNTNFVYSVESNLLEPAYCDITNQFIGFNFNCNIADIKKALREIYNNYNLNLQKSNSGRIWVQKYLPNFLKNKYLNLVKPKKIVFGTKNVIENNYIMTNSLKFYKKYKKTL